MFFIALIAFILAFCSSVRFCLCKAPFPHFLSFFNHDILACSSVVRVSPALFFFKIFFCSSVKFFLISVFLFSTELFFVAVESAAKVGVREPITKAPVKAQAIIFFFITIKVKN